MTDKYVLNNCIIDLEQDTVLKPDGQQEYIKKNQRILISVLIDIYPSFASIDDIKTKVWGHTFISNESVTQLVKQTRAVINDESKIIIVNQKGKGYSLSHFSQSSSLDSHPEISVPITDAITNLPSGTGILTGNPYVKRYLFASAVFWAFVVVFLTYKEAEELSLTRVSDISELNVTLSNRTETSVSISHENITCHLNANNKEAICEDNK